jgi:hypothetical protein
VLSIVETITKEAHMILPPIVSENSHGIQAGTGRICERIASGGFVGQNDVYSMLIYASTDWYIKHAALTLGGVQDWSERR